MKTIFILSCIITFIFSPLCQAENSGNYYDIKLFLYIPKIKKQGERDQSARHEFMRLTGYPKGRPGYIIDHIIPLKRGGADIPSNMQWQAEDEAKIKDRFE